MTAASLHAAGSRQPGAAMLHRETALERARRRVSAARRRIAAQDRLVVALERKMPPVEPGFLALAHEVLAQLRLTLQGLEAALAWETRQACDGARTSTSSRPALGLGRLRLLVLCEDGAWKVVRGEGLERRFATKLDALRDAMTEAAGAEAAGLDVAVFTIGLDDALTPFWASGRRGWPREG